LPKASFQQIHVILNRGFKDQEGNGNKYIFIEIYNYLGLSCMIAHTKINWRALEPLKVRDSVIM